MLDEDGSSPLRKRAVTVEESLRLCTPATQKCHTKQEHFNICVGGVFLEGVCLCAHQYLRGKMVISLKCYKGFQEKIDKRHTNQCICPD